MFGNSENPDFQIPNTLKTETSEVAMFMSPGTRHIGTYIFWMFDKSENPHFQNIGKMRVSFPKAGNPQQLKNT